MTRPRTTGMDAAARERLRAAKFAKRGTETLAGLDGSIWCRAIDWMHDQFAEGDTVGQTPRDGDGPYLDGKNFRGLRWTIGRDPATGRNERAPARNTIRWVRFKYLPADRADALAAVPGVVTRMARVSFFKGVGRGHEWRDTRLFRVDHALALLQFVWAAADKSGVPQWRPKVGQYLYGYTAAYVASRPIRADAVAILRERLAAAGLEADCRVPDSESPQSMWVELCLPGNRPWTGDETDAVREAVHDLTQLRHQRNLKVLGFFLRFTHGDDAADDDGE